MKNPKRKFTILFIRDDSNVRRYRLSSLALKGTVLLFVVFVLVATGAFFTGVLFWDNYQVLQGQNQKLGKRLREAEDRLVQTENKLKRLQNMEEFFKVGEQEGMETLLSGETVSNEPIAQSQEKTAKHQKDMFSSIDLQVVAIQNLYAKPGDGNTVSLYYDLLNTNKLEEVYGSARVSFVGNDGSEYPVRSLSKGLSFRIKRFKKMETQFSLPQDKKMKDLFGLRLTVYNRVQGVLFSKTYQLFDILR